jgi:hypothetical protein
VTRSIQVYVLSEPVFAYSNNFSSAGDFVGTGFSIGGYSGFTSGAIHSQHDYPDNANLTYMLTVPIRVAQQNAYVSFDEVVIVEPGEPGSVFGDSDFWDYVIVEGSLDGVSWIPIEDGYDCRRDPAWETAWNNGTPGSSSLLRAHTMDLQNVFAWQDTILLRFRLYADASANGWGWAIDNLVIQVGSPTDVPGGPPGRVVALEQNAPNPFNPATTIRYTLPRDGQTSLRVYDVRGRLVRSLLEGAQAAGAYEILWDGRDNGGAAVSSGMYVYRLRAAGETHQRSMMLVR